MGMYHSLKKGGTGPTLPYHTFFAAATSLQMRIISYYRRCPKKARKVNDQPAITRRYDNCVKQPPDAHLLLPHSQILII
jgi:hypothetical protein